MKAIAPIFYGLIGLAGLVVCHAEAGEPVEAFDVASMHVERYGTKGPALILLPGLACGSWVWKQTIEHLEGRYQLYAVTLSGFSGRPAGVDSSMEAAAASLHELVLSRHLVRPIVVGHSLGGTLGLMHAELHPDEIGALVSLDGLPVFPGTENVPPADRAALAEGVSTQLDVGSQEQFAAQQLGYMRTIGVTSDDEAQSLARQTSRSDRHAVAAYAASDMRLDLRPGLSRIAVPVLEVVPYHFTEREALGVDEPGKVAYYRSLLQGVPRLTVVALAPSRHFLMVDQPQEFLKVLDGFLDAVDR